MNIPQNALQSAVLKVLADEIAARQKLVKTLLEDGFGDTGTTQTVAQLPDGTRVATVSLAGAGGKTAVVVDERAFTDWAVENYPGETVTTVRDGSRKKWLDGAKAAGRPIDPLTGEVIPGIEIRDSSPYVSVRFKTGGKEAVVDAWLAGELTGIDLIAPPALEAGDHAA